MQHVRDRCMLTCALNSYCMVFHAGFKFLNFPPWFQGVTSMDACVCAFCLHMLVLKFSFLVLNARQKSLPVGKHIVKRCLAFQQHPDKQTITITYTVYKVIHTMI